MCFQDLCFFAPVCCLAFQDCFFSNTDLLWEEVLSFPKGCGSKSMDLDCHVLREAVKLNITAKTKYVIYFCNILAHHCVPWSEQCLNLMENHEMQVAEFMLLLLRTLLPLPCSDLLTFLQPWQILLPGSIILGATFKNYSGPQSKGLQKNLCANPQRSKKCTMLKPTRPVYNLKCIIKKCQTQSQNVLQVKTDWA